MSQYNPQITIEKGAIEGISATAIAGIIAALFNVPQDQAIQIAGLIGLGVAAWKSFRNWNKNRSRTAQ